MTQPGNGGAINNAISNTNLDAAPNHHQIMDSAAGFAGLTAGSRRKRASSNNFNFDQQGKQAIQASDSQRASHRTAT